MYKKNFGIELLLRCLIFDGHLMAGKMKMQRNEGACLPQACKLVIEKGYSIAEASSMSRKGNCRDNACMESFFGSLKTEMDWR